MACRLIRRRCDGMCSGDVGLAGGMRLGTERGLWRHNANREHYESRKEKGNNIQELYSMPDQVEEPVFRSDRMMLPNPDKETLNIRDATTMLSTG